MSEIVLPTCTRCGGDVPANSDSGQFFRVTSFWLGKKNQDFFYCSLDCLRRAAIQGLVNEAVGDNGAAS